MDNMFGTRVQENIDRQPETTSRTSPLAKRLVTATASGSADRLFEVSEGRARLVKRLVVANITGAAVSINIDAVPGGGSISTSTAELRGLSVPANSAIDLTDLIGGFYGASTALDVWASTGSALMLSGYAEDIF